MCKNVSLLTEKCVIALKKCKQIVYWEVSLNIDKKQFD